MSDIPGDRPVPAPRKSRVPYGTYSPRMTKSNIHVPQEHESNNVVTGHSYLPSHKSDESLMNSGYSNDPRYTAPIVSSRSPKVQYSGPQSPYISPYHKQVSTPTLHSTSPHTQPGSDKLLNYTQPVYSGPQIVTSPQPLSSSYGAGSLSFKQENPSPVSTPRKNSQGSVQFYLSSEPSVHDSSVQLLSQTNEFVEIERQKQVKAKLIQEVAHLSDQKTTLEKELKDFKSESDTLKRDYEQHETELDMLQNKEGAIKRRIAQYEQTLGLLEKLQHNEGGLRRDDTNRGEKEKEIKKLKDEISELEFTLREREAFIKKRELELQSEGDVLFQRKKELDLREYDLKNFRGKEIDRPSNLLAHEQRESEIQEKEHRLFQMETSLHQFERNLRSEEDRLSKWNKQLQDEDIRVRQNLELAKELMAEANRKEKEVMGASAAAVLQDEERRGVAGKLGGDSGSVGTTLTVSTGQTNINTHGAPGGGNTKPFTDDKSPVDDEMYARMFQMQLNEDIKQKDIAMAKQLSMQTSTSVQPPEIIQSDAELAFQAQLEIMGIAPGSVDAEALKKQLIDELERQRQVSLQSNQDTEIAFQLQENDS